MDNVLTVTRKKRFSGEVRVPGDKSISHRAIMLASLSDGPCKISGFLPGFDCLATLNAFEKMGVQVVREDPTTLTVFGRHGVGGLLEPKEVISCENSGTTSRLLIGVLSGAPFFAVLIGDASLQTRPMKRVIEPLKLMGASILGRAEDSFLPVAIRGRPLTGISYKLPIASAQVKSAILLAGLEAEGETNLVEPLPSRDHTERMLRKMGVSCRSENGKITLHAKSLPSAIPIFVPGDPSSAAFFIVAAAIHPGSDLVVRGISLNPTRIGFIDVLKSMGAEINILEKSNEEFEPIGDLRIRGGTLRGITLDPSLVPNIIDEIPILAVAMAIAEGKSMISGAQELRKKESDRISSIVKEFKGFGIEIVEKIDGFEILGKSQLRAPEVSNSCFDHRIAMSLAILGTISDGTARINGSDCIAISFPSFESILQSF